MLLVVKKFLHMMTIESIQLQHRLSCKLCLQGVFPLRKPFVENVLLSLVEKTMTMYVQPSLANLFINHLHIQSMHVKKDHMKFLLWFSTLFQ
jgi:hypothetical protein